jgi:hypothetical protein
VSLWRIARSDKLAIYEVAAVTSYCDHCEPPHSSLAVDENDVLTCKYFLKKGPHCFEASMEK